MAEWFAAAAAAAASALASAAGTDAWQGVRAGIAELFGRSGRRRQELAQQWADQTAAEIERAPADQQDHLRQQWAHVWQQRLADLVEEHPELGEELHAWASALLKQFPAADQTWMNTFVARDNAHQYNAPGGFVAVHHTVAPPVP